MGDGSTEWSAKRVDLGYQDPFPIKMVEIGNEDDVSNGLSSYNAYRFAMFHDKIKEKYPEMKVYASTTELDPAPAGAGLDYHEYAVSQALVFRDLPWTHRFLAASRPLYSGIRLL